MAEVLKKFGWLQEGKQGIVCIKNGVEYRYIGVQIKNLCIQLIITVTEVTPPLMEHIITVTEVTPPLLELIITVTEVTPPLLELIITVAEVTPPLLELIITVTEVTSPLLGLIITVTEDTLLCYYTINPYLKPRCNRINKQTSSYMNL